MLDVPRLVGVSLLVAGVVLQGAKVSEIRRGRALEAEEMRYRAQTILGDISW